MKTSPFRLHLGRLGLRLFVEIALASFVPLAGLAVWLARESGTGPNTLAQVALCALATMGLALLVVARHAQRVLGQLQSLNITIRDLTRGKLLAHSCPSSKDEFGRPARILKRLAEDLSLRRSVDEVLSQIDEALLIKPDKRALIRGALQCLSFVTKAEITAFAYFESQVEPTLTVYLARKSGRSRLETLRLELDPDLARHLAASPECATRSESPFPQEFTRKLYKESATQDFFLFPIVRNGRSWGFLISGHRAPAAFARKRVELLGAVAHRLISGFRCAEREELLHSLAFVDKLTGLPNRVSFESTLHQRLTGLQPGDAGAAVLVIDIDRFKQVNDAFGHATGDRLLIEVRRRIQVHLDEQDAIARVGGDEFAVLLGNTPSSRHTAQVARKIIQSLSRCVNIEGNRIYTGASVGIAQAQSDGQDATDLLTRAEIAMYRAKTQGRSRAVFYASGMNAESKRRSRLNLELRKALQRNELLLHYQPRFALGTGALFGVEALLRWQHPDRGLLVLADFVDDALAIGLIPQIGNWVLKEACLQHKRWREAGVDVSQVAVKVFGDHLPRSDFVATLRQYLIDADMPAGSLEIEVSGAVLAEGEQRAQLALQQLAADGVPVTVDDFGRGDTIIRCLKSQPAQKLKIDMKAIDAHSSEDDSVRILHSIIDMAHALGKIVIAEGIERPEQLLLLKTLGCDLGQGLLPGKPSTAQEIERSFQGILAESALDGSAAHAASPKLRAVPILAPDLHAAKHRATAAVGTAEVAQQDEELAELRTVPMYLAEDYPTVSSA